MFPHVCSSLGLLSFLKKIQYLMTHRELCDIENSFLQIYCGFHRYKIMYFLLFVPAGPTGPGACYMSRVQLPIRNTIAVSLPISLTLF